MKAAIDYICNPEKTDGSLLISSFGCAPETADLEFAWTRKHAIDKGSNLGRHLIQAFGPGEVSAEEAHEIGKQLADEILKGKYEYVLTTHVDRDHIHNHLIFCSVSFQDHKHYHSNKRSYHEIRRVSDWLCQEHGLSTELHSFERQCKLSTPSCLASEIHDAGMQLLRTNYRFPKPLRSVGIRGMDLIPIDTAIQLNLFEDPYRREKRERLETTVDEIRHRFGHHSVSRAVTMLDASLGTINPKGDHIIHPVGYFKPS